MELLSHAILLVIASLCCVGFAFRSITHNRRGRRFTEFERIALMTIFAIAAVYAAIRIVSRTVS